MKIPKCPFCGAEMKKETTEDGEFWRCAMFPRCHCTVDIPYFACPCDREPCLRYQVNDDEDCFPEQCFHIVYAPHPKCECPRLKQIRGRFTGQITPNEAFIGTVDLCDFLDRNVIMIVHAKEE